MARARGKLIITGDKEVNKALRQAGTDGRKALVKSLESRAEDIADDAADNAPVDEGTLRDNIIYRKAYDDDFGIIFLVGPKYPDAAHGHLVELGTVNMAAQPFLRPALDASEPATKQDIIKSLQKGMKLE